MVPRMAQANNDLTQQLARLTDQISTVIVGKRTQIEDCIACLLAGGHLLIQDVPGVGKTTLAHALSVSLGLDFRRVQFTADMMPSDLVGVSVYERSKESFVFHAGPVFAQVLLADEINRAGPKTQSALLEAMEEQQVTVENETRKLPQPFFVIATQNPTDQLGTYPLPESQLDRFLMCITLGYPDRASERALLAGGHLLIEDVPGVGKTTLAHTLAVCLGLDFRRVQFTADLMPSDLIGVSVFERAKDAFVFHPGPVFAQVLLADEINRAGPKTQSALLEAMEEQQVSVENDTRPLPQPFFVIGTQNPSDQLGTYPLPESQLDRFLMCITLGYQIGRAHV